VAFVTAAAAGITENVISRHDDKELPPPDLTCTIDGCCDGEDCSPEEHRRHHSFSDKIIVGFRYAFTEVWDDLAGWFLIGLLLAGLIMTIIPANFFSQYLGRGLPAMLLMLAVGLPLYICATASTPIAAALILKGVSPGAALVFLLAGPATNITSLTVLFGILGKRTTFIYLATIALSAVLFGLALDQVYATLGISAKAMVGQAAELMPLWAQWAGALIILILSVKPVSRSLMARFRPKIVSPDKVQTEPGSKGEIPVVSSCGSTTGGCSSCGTIKS
jgi:hypothetical protein